MYTDGVRTNMGDLSGNSNVGILSNATFSRDHMRDVVD